MLAGNMMMHAIAHVCKMALQRTIDTHTHPRTRTNERFRTKKAIIMLWIKDPSYTHTTYTCPHRDLSAHGTHILVPVPVLLAESLLCCLLSFQSLAGGRHCQQGPTNCRRLQRNRERPTNKRKVCCLHGVWPLFSIQVRT